MGRKKHTLTQKKLVTKSAFGLFDNALMALCRSFIELEINTSKKNIYVCAKTGLVGVVILNC